MSRLSWTQRFSFWIEAAIMADLVPSRGPGPIFRLVFKLPVLNYRLRLGRGIGRRVLLLTTIGRKTGQRRVTPIGYSHDPATGTYFVMAGWGGRTDWYRNARAQPHVHVQVGALEFDAVAEVVPDEVVAQQLSAITRLNPYAVRMWSRWAGQPVDGSDESLRRMTPCFPMLALRPIISEKPGF